jgi:hypothetical protein
MQVSDEMDSALIFAYNANSGLFNTLTDIAHKIFSPETYACQLCALTHSNFTMRQEWKQFLASLGRPLEFLHADEMKEKYGVAGVPLPAIFRKAGAKPVGWIGAEAINSCRSLDELQQLILEKLSAEQKAALDDSSPDADALMSSIS